MRSGMLRDRITVQFAAAGTAAASGEVPVTWHDLFTCWASVTTLSGREQLAAFQVSAEYSVQVVMRYDRRVTAQHRMKFGDRYLYPASVIPDIKQTQLTLLCVEQAE